MHDELEPLEPGEGMAMYVESREDELAARSLDLHEKHLQKFVEWCSAEGIRNMNDVTGRTIHQYRMSLKREYAMSTISIHLSTIRQFTRFCESIDAVHEGVAEKIDLPGRTAQARDEKLEADEADEILSYLRKYHYASRSHALLSLLWHTGLRVGTVRALDVDDFDKERERLRIRHRPETGTPLKNKDAAERYVALSPDVTDVIADYIEEYRHDVTDAHGRRPLFTTRNGRPVNNTLRRNVWAVTRPCKTGRECPHNRDIERCDGAGRTNDAAKCPSSVSPHPVRRGSITHHLRKDVPEKVVSDRANVSGKVLDRHYDRRTESEKMEKRRSFISNL